MTTTERCTCETFTEGPGAGFIVTRPDMRCPVHSGFKATDVETGEEIEGQVSQPTGGTYEFMGATYDHLGNKLGPPYPLGSPELREHVAYMVQQCEFARGLDPVQRALWEGDHEKAARLMLAEVPADVIEVLDGDGQD